MLTFRILELAVEESEGVNNPLPVGPAVDVFVVALNVCVAELLFVLVAAAAFDQESPVHPCLIALFTIRKEFTEELPFIIQIHFQLKHTLLSNHPTLDCSTESNHAETKDGFMRMILSVRSYTR